MGLPRQWSALALSSLLAFCASAHQSNAFADRPLQPEAATSSTIQKGWQGQHFAVAAANPLATAAGYQMLKAGGSAVDAAVAVQMVLTLVEPQSSGIGGGAFLLHHNGRFTEAFDGRETAPARVNERLFLDDSGQPMAFYDRVIGGRAVGVPGVVPMLELAHQQHGKLAWAALFAPAIELSEQGFPVSARLNALLVQDVHLKKDPVAAAYFYDPQGRPWPVGHRLKNPALASVFRHIAANGSKALLHGALAQAIVNKVQQHASVPGLLSLQDLAAYQVKQREPLCTDFQARNQDYLICGMPPPSSGGIAVAQILGMLRHTPAGASELDAGLPRAEWLHYYSEASRLAFADRAQYLGDPDFVAAPAGRWQSLLEPRYLAQRAALIGPLSMATALPGKPLAPLGPAAHYAPMPEQAEFGTSHLSIIDAHGNALAMTSSIEDGFGSRQMVNSSDTLIGGFLLNNQLSDFSALAADEQGRPIANRVEPGKRPRSSMAPTLVIDKATGRTVMTGGSPGGAMIIHYTAKLLWASLIWGKTPQQAIALPNFGWLDDRLYLERERFPPATTLELRSRGAQVREVDLSSGLQALSRDVRNKPNMLQGGADPRREGLVLGN
ncbi:MAG: gamma-glutamyltransferase [Burkholderiaceae bacterium]